jgi:hypothetical protein
MVLDILGDFSGRCPRIGIDTRQTRVQGTQGHGLITQEK